MNNGVNTPASRRFNLGDGLILIGSLALTLGVLRSHGWFDRLPDHFRSWSWYFTTLVGRSHGNLPIPSRGTSTRMVVFEMIDELPVQLLGCLLLGLTLVQPVMRLRAPRPILCDLVRQSGFVVCLAVIFGALISVELWSISSIEVPAAVITASVLLLLWPILGLPPWRKESSWIDRLGRAVGWGWIVSTAGVMVLHYA